MFLLNYICKTDCRKFFPSVKSHGLKKTKQGDFNAYFVFTPK